jgi:nitric oxide reductase subunit B
MIFIVMALLIAGIVQVYLQRIVGMEFLEVQNFLRVWFEVRMVAGILFTFGSIFLVWDILRLAKPEKPGQALPEPASSPAA